MRPTQDDKMLPPWPKPRIHTMSKEEKIKEIRMCWDYQIAEAADLADIWRFRGGLVTSGMSAVGKAKKKKKLVVGRNGSKGKQQSCIFNFYFSRHFALRQ